MEGRMHYSRAGPHDSAETLCRTPWDDPSTAFGGTATVAPPEIAVKQAIAAAHMAASKVVCPFAASFSLCLGRLHQMLEDCVSDNEVAVGRLWLDVAGHFCLQRLADIPGPQHSKAACNAAQAAGQIQGLTYCNPNAHRREVLGWAAGGGWRG